VGHDRLEGFVPGGEGSDAGGFAARMCGGKGIMGLVTRASSGEKELRNVPKGIVDGDGVLVIDISESGSTWVGVKCM
jgi:hypothetical protein